MCVVGIALADRGRLVEAARAAYFERLERQVDPDGRLSAGERRALAEQEHRDLVRSLVYVRRA